MKYENLNTLFNKRRSVYSLNRKLPLWKKELVKIIEDIIHATPSSFDSKSTRIVVLFDDQHEKLWDATEEILRAIVPADQFDYTRQRINGFRSAAGSVLFFEDENVIKELQEKFPTYADNFPRWAEHTNAMHQYAVWLALTSFDIGANLQHYNPLINDFVTANWDIQSHWSLKAQMVFGGIENPANIKTYSEIDNRLKVFGL